MAETVSIGLATLAVLIFACLATSNVIQGVVSGVTRIGQWPVVTRATSPFWFWFCTLFHTVIAVVCLWLGSEGVRQLFG